MSQLSAEDEVELQSLLKQLLISVNDRISGAPSTECAEEILLHLEETDKNFHNYEFVKYLRQYVQSSLGTVVEEETKNLTRGEGQHAIGSGHDNLIHAITRRTRDSAEFQQMMLTLKNTMIMVVESLINKFEEDQMRKEELQRSQSNSQYMDNCSDSDSSFNQSYAFLRQEQLQVLAEKLDASKPKEVRWQALQALCCAPPSDVLSCESWSSLRRKLCAALTEPDPDLSDNVLQFFAKSFSSCPLNVTREIYTSLAKSVESSFASQKLSFPSGSASVDINRPEVVRLLKQIRLMNDFQKEVTTFWIRHPEKYMEEVIDSTFSLLSFHHELGSNSSGTEKVLEPIHLLALLDIKATWFNKWMHGSYSRTVVLRLLEKKYKSLIVAALQCCVHYSESCVRVDPQPAEQQSTAQRSVYSGKELEYAVFVHSLCFLGKVLVYTNGRKLFPMKVRKRKDPVSLTDLVVILIHIMYQHPRPPHSDPSSSSSSPHTDSLSPCSLVMEVLWALCERTECAAECLYQPAVIETLLTPVIALLNGQQVQTQSHTHTLPALKTAAASARGSSAALVVVQFTLRLLNKELPSLSESEAPPALCGAFVFVCRQMYNTCEGLQVLMPHGLHTAVAAAWKKTSSLSDRTPTPVPGVTAVASSSQELQERLIWEETLLDSLLNFAATPKGLLLLQQTGAINECVSYMFSRFSKKLQVSRCEKFGYGVMVTQVAATAPGVAALHSSGFVRALVVELWSTLECGSEDVRVVRPKPTPMDPIDRSCHKSFLSLVNLLSSSRSVWELLGQQPLANKSEYTLREMPTSVPDLIDRLISVDSDAKIHSLFHYEQSHTFGLRLLSVLCCNLDSFLLLESQYNICSTLLRSQRENVAEPDADDRTFIIDSLSVERNHVLVRVSVVGGPSERRLPPRALQQGDDPYPWPMFSSYPPPPCYTLNPPKIPHNSQDSEFAAFLASAKDAKTDESWMATCRRLYCRVMTSKPAVVTGQVLADLLDKVVAHLSSSTTECFFSPAQYKAEETSVKSAALSSVEQLGINTCLRYGRYLSLLRDDSAADDALTLLMKHLKVFLSSQRIKSSSELVTQQDYYYPGHDWLASTVFLIMAADVDRSLRLLLSLSSLLTSMCLHWLTQCFWNYLDWTEICHYVSTCVVMGADYQVYMCVAIFKHLQREILQRTQSQELQVFLKEEPIQGFRVGSYLEFMEGLETKYRDLVLTDMKTIRNPVG
ncbi:protein broad-minded [Solea solea]|uniref:protein broad-minded n=1 Tax=Solea solea TaxID=90069 RepID=UPI00272D050F|nr:protein broad-minded [Solea solea]